MSVTEVLLGAPGGGAVFTTSNFRGILGTRISRRNGNNGKNEGLYECLIYTRGMCINLGGGVILCILFIIFAREGYA